LLIETVYTASDNRIRVHNNAGNAIANNLYEYGYSWKNLSGLYCTQHQQTYFYIAWRNKLTRAAADQRRETA
jgi:hypothetical protein